MSCRLPTVADLRAARAQQMTMLRYFTLDEAAAAEVAGIDIASVPPEILFHPRTPDVAVSIFSVLRSMGAGVGCDTQYLFANEILGYTKGHVPRHSEVYPNFKVEYVRLQAERIAAFAELSAPVATGTFPEDLHLVAMPPDEVETFTDRLQPEEGLRLH